MAISKEMEAIIIAEAQQLLEDKNRMSKAIAALLRNKIEDFHVSYLSDEQMKELNPIIRNAVFTFLSDYKGTRANLEDNYNIQMCYNYIATATAPFFKQYDLEDEIFEEFLDLILEELIVALYSAADKGMQLLAHEKLFVPSYWEDCTYLESIHNE